MTSPSLLSPADSPFGDMPNPTEADLADPVFNAIYAVTKRWDVNAPEFYFGYCGLNGSHVMVILNAVRAALAAAPSGEDQGSASIPLADAPPGWKLVPVEPTEQMLWDGHHKIDFDRRGQNTLEMEHESQRFVHDKAGNRVEGIAAGTTVKQDMQEAWAAMLAAAPVYAESVPKRSTESPPSVEGLMELVAAYWLIAYREGNENRIHDDENGSASETLYAIRAYAQRLASAPKHSTKSAQGEPGVPEPVAYFCNSNEGLDFVPNWIEIRPGSVLPKGLTAYELRKPAAPSPQEPGVRDALVELKRLREALAVYADPSFYHACSFMFDRPTGGFDEDFDFDEDYGRDMPGKMARAALASTSPAPEAAASPWVPMHERAPAPDTECVVMVRYTLGRPPFATVDRWEEQREDPTGMGGATISTGFGWSDNYEADVIAWMPIPKHPPAEWDQRLPDVHQVGSPSERPAATDDKP